MHPVSAKGLAQIRKVCQDILMRVGEFELIEPVPELRNPCAIVMLRPWVDVGRVGTIVLTKLERYLGAKELGRLARPGTYFDFTRYRPRTRIVGGQKSRKRSFSENRQGVIKEYFQ